MKKLLTMISASFLIRASSTVSLLCVKILSLNEVLLTERTLLLLCDRLTRILWASACFLLSCSVLSCRILSLISGSSQISGKWTKYMKMFRNHGITSKSLPAGVSSCLFLAFRSAPACTSISKTSNCKKFLVITCNCGIVSNLHDPNKLRHVQAANHLYL